jgi:hypothetical protein
MKGSPMVAPVTTETLDDVLTLQLLLAWAGESPIGGGSRLRWWKTDLVDAEGGGDLWKRLLPRTHLWAGLDAARRAARLVDEKARREAARADEMVTLFHFGFEVDEALDERLAQHKLDAKPPISVMGRLSALGAPFAAGAMLEALKDSSLDLRYKVVPGGRQLKRIDDEDFAKSARRLACVALIEPPPAYPTPFILNEGPRGER